MMTDHRLSSPMDLATSSQWSWPSDIMSTLSPYPASSSAYARPIPCPLPVTTKEQRNQSDQSTQADAKQGRIQHFTGKLCQTLFRSCRKNPFWPLRESVSPLGPPGWVQSRLRIVGGWVWSLTTLAHVRGRLHCATLLRGTVR